MNFIKMYFYYMYFYVLIFFFLSVLHGLQDLSFPTRDWTRTLCNESEESSLLDPLLDHEGIPLYFNSSCIY